MSGPKGKNEMELWPYNPLMRQTLKYSMHTQIDFGSNMGGIPHWYTTIGVQREIVPQK